jgi:hypothetical protein
MLFLVAFAFGKPIRERAERSGESCRVVKMLKGYIVAASSFSHFNFVTHLTL